MSSYYDAKDVALAERSRHYGMGYDLVTLLYTWYARRQDFLRDLVDHVFLFPYTHTPKRTFMRLVKKIDNTTILLG